MVATSGDGAGWAASDVFISYKREQRERIELVAEALRALELKVWFDAGLNPGSSFDEEINREVRAAKAVLVMWSPAALNSDWVRAEASIARGKDSLVSAFIEPCDLYPPFNLIHTEDLHGFTGNAAHRGWRKIVAAIGRKAGRPGLGDYLDASTKGEAEIDGWRRTWPNDPLALRLWREKIALAAPDEAERLRAEHADLLAAAELRTPDEVERVTKTKVRKIDRSPKRPGFVLFAALAAAIGGLVFAGAYVGFMLSVEPMGLPSGGWRLAAATVFAVAGAAWMGMIAGLAAKPLWPRTRPASWWRYPVIAIVAGAVAAHVAAYGWIVLTALMTGPSVLMEFPAFVAEFELAILVASGGMAVILLIAAVVFDRVGRPERRIARYSPGSIGRRLQIGGGLAVVTAASLAATMYLPSIDYAETLEIRVAKALFVRGYDFEGGLRPSYIENDYTFTFPLCGGLTEETGCAGNMAKFEKAVREAEAFYKLPETGKPSEALLKAMGNETITAGVSASQVRGMQMYGHFNYTSISEALMRSPPGAEIMVSAGEYIDNVSVADGRKLRSSGGATIRRRDPSAPALVVYGPQSVAQGFAVEGDDEVVRVLHLGELSDAVVRGASNAIGLVLVDGGRLINSTVETTGGPFAGVMVRGAYDREAAEPLDDTLVENNAITGGGIEVMRGNPAVRKNRVSGAGILVNQMAPGDGVMGVLRENTIADIASGAVAIEVRGGAAPVIEENRILNIVAHCVWVREDSKPVVRNNRMSACGTGGYAPVQIDKGAQGEVSGNVVLASEEPIVEMQPGATTIIRDNRSKD